ncbi:MAG: hypothetical protein IPJ88_18885 [Myxococcales bacterium]|nr:MAG: hypothetical protein IPJ88_18885 [Myxococcales bacterium]
MNVDPVSGLVIKSGSSSFELHFATWLRADLQKSSSSSTQGSYSVPLARPLIQANFLDSQLQFLVQPEFAGKNPSLLDLQLEWVPNPIFRVRIGQFRTPFSRAFITPIVRLQLADRGAVVSRFSLGRDTGAMIYGESPQHRFEYAVGVFNGATIDSLDGNRLTPMLVVRTGVNFGTAAPYDQAPSLESDSPSGVAVGLGGAYRKRNVTLSDGSLVLEESWNATTDITFMQGPFSITGEGFLKVSRTPFNWDTGLGAFIQSGIFLWPRAIELGARAGWFSDNDKQQSYEGFVTGFWNTSQRSLGHHLKTTLVYRFNRINLPTAPISNSHELLLQTQMWF